MVIYQEIICNKCVDCMLLVHKRRRTYVLRRISFFIWCTRNTYSSSIKKEYKAYECNAEITGNREQCDVRWVIVNDFFTDISIQLRKYRWVFTLFLKQWWCVTVCVCFGASLFVCYNHMWLHEIKIRLHMCVIWNLKKCLGKSTIHPQHSTNTIVA